MLSKFHNMFRSFNQKISDKIVYWFVPYDFITPNRITYFSLIIDLISIYFYFLGDWISLILASGLMYVGLILDNIDGDLARIKNQATHYGEFLDTATDRIFGALRIVAIGFGLRNAHFGLNLGPISLVDITEYDISIGYVQLTLFALFGSYVYNYLGMYDFALSHKYQNPVGKPMASYKRYVLLFSGLTNNMFLYLMLFSTFAIVLTVVRYWRLSKKYSSMDNN